MPATILLEGRQGLGLSTCVNRPYDLLGHYFTLIINRPKVPALDIACCTAMAGPGIDAERPFPTAR